ncbi:ubiquitin-associated protein 1 [Solenopsis invicta]|uniref:ubiquitin-associated protein 1 n=1 Tax=Solenopsis invicta TaxID=13686 RepID=UPI0001FEBFE5|nr:ubiquitin-associated protein 1 [Solenopsis invicta]XP_039312150.1 ubiquitin-associated protein 1 [Solenopsis invicta]
MARPSVSAQCDLVASYMDGVHVKIAEAYKPPRKIGLLMAYNNRLPDVSKLMYDFSLEKSVLEKMCEWRKARQAYTKARQARLKEKKRKEREEAPPSPPPLDCVKQLPVNAPPAPETTILMPQPLSPPANDLQDHEKTNGGLDYADFDNDTSSPFDNMELKTINDMEELAQVLQPRSQWIPAGKLENIINELTIDDMSEISKEEEADTESQGDDDGDIDAHSIENHRSVSAIMQELQKELERPVMENWKPWPDLESPVGSDAYVTSRHDDSTSSNHAKPSTDLLSGMTEDDLKLVMQLSDMGFPKCRAARAVLELGRVHEKKIVEYLLAIQSLEEVGVPSDYAETALTLAQHDQVKAKIYYENLCTLKDLGFPEDEASAALVKCNFDRDKALDFLIA